MKRILVIAVLIARTILSAAEPVDFKGPPPPVKIPQPPQAWLGLKVDKPDVTITAHVPSLPPGIGFVVSWIDENGPAKAAGLQELDLLWKLGDQMLVNEGQLAALLRLSKPGDEIILTGFRAGQPLKVPLILGETPVLKRPFPADLVEAAIFPGECGGPMRVVNVAKRTASFSTDEGSATVQREGEVYKVKIQGPKDELIYQGDLPADGSVDKIPESWRRRIYALRRGLDLALDGRMMPPRQVRPRVIPPATPKP